MNNKKIYVDISHDKINGQQKMQRALFNRVIEMGLYESKFKADVLVYVQVGFDKSIVDEWKRFKEQGKKIVFIHHYLWSEIYNRAAIFNVEGLLDLIDLHIVMAEDSEIYKELKSRNYNIIIREQAGSDYNKIRDEYFKRFENKIQKSIAYVGRLSKGYQEFIDYTSQEKFKDWTKFIFVPEYFKELMMLDSSYASFVHTQNEELYEKLSDIQFLYLNPDIIQSSKHLETVVHEAVPCGTIIIHGENIRRYYEFPDEITGFISDIDLNIDYHKNQIMQFNFLSNNYLSINEIINDNIYDIIEL